jgi:hypothetical protein
LGEVGHGVYIEDKAATFDGASAQSRPEAASSYLLTLVSFAPTLEAWMFNYRRIRERSSAWLWKQAG